MEWYYFALISAFLSALAAIIEKKTLFKEKALNFTFILSLFNMVLALPFLFFTDFSKITLASLIILLFKSILNAFAFLCVMYAIKNLELSSALPLLVITPGFVAVFAFIFLREVLTLYEISGLILIILGAYVLNIKENQKLAYPFKILIKNKGYQYILVALSLFTATSIIDKFLLAGKLAPEAFMGFQHIFLAIIFLTMFILYEIKNKNKVLINKLSSIKLILILSIVTIGYRYFEIIAIKNSSSVALAIVIKRLSVFFAVLVGGKLFKEHNLFRKVVSISLLIIGTILVIRF